MDYLFVAVGLAALTASTVPSLEGRFEPALQIALWSSLAYFAAETALELRAALAAKHLYYRAFSGSLLIDCLTVLPVPVALIMGVTADSAWLLASLWILKIAQRLPGLRQLWRVLVLEARALAGVLALFMIVLFLSAAAMYAVESAGQPKAFGTLPHALWWAVVTLTTTGYGDEVPRTYLGHFLAGLVMVCGIATFGLFTGILATGFAAENSRRNFLQVWDLIREVPFFQSLDPSAIAQIAQKLRRLDVPAKTLIIRRGKVGDCMYFIVEGEVQVDLDSRAIRLGAGAFFGELALLGLPIRTANVSTTQPSTLLLLDVADFRTFTADHPELARVIETEGQRRLQEISAMRAEPVPAGE